MRKGKFTYRNECISCRSRDFDLVMDLGWQPLAGTFLKSNEIGKEKYYPLKVYRCQYCGLVQLRHIVNRKELFQSFLSSVSMSEHFYRYAQEIIEIKPEFVVEIGSNDGALLEPLRNEGVKVLGVEPVKSIADIAFKKGIPTIVNYFDNQVALAIVKSQGQADVILANNVMAHIDNIRSVLRGINTLLTDDGTFIMEVHHYDPQQYDNYYHEHLYYYTVDSLAYLLRQFNLQIFEVKPVPTHSGSMRVYVKKVKPIDIAQDLYMLMFDAHLAGNKVIGYGASGRGNTLLNLWHIKLDYIIDENPYRYNHYTPGTHIPVIPPDKASLAEVDYILILAWNYKDQIIKKCKKMGYKGKFIVPLPRLEVI